MKHRLLTFLAFITPIIAALSCTPAPESKPAAATTVTAPASAAEIEPMITQMERDWTAAIVKKDLAALEGILADDFNGTSPTAETYPKSTAIDDLKSGTYVVNKMDLDEVSVNVYGDAAVAFTSQEEKSKYAGKDTSGHYHFTDVWI